MSDDTTVEELEDLEEIDTGGSKKKIFIIVGVLFVVCNIGWGAAFLLSSGGGAEAAAPPAEATQTAEPAEVEEDSQEERAREERGPMYKLDPFVVNLDEPRGTHYLRISVEVEVKHEANLAEVDSHVVVLRDRFISALSSKRLSDLTRPQDKEALREELLDLSRQAVGRRAVKGIYFTEFLTQ